MECRPGATDRGPMKLTPEAWVTLVDVNRTVNQILAINDIDLHGVEAFWT